MRITRSYEISAGHHLPLHEGKCREPHGHNYVIEVTVEGTQQDSGPATGMVMDFADLDRMSNACLNVLDHQDLNELDATKYLTHSGKRHQSLLMPPTAENICEWIFMTIEDSVRYYGVGHLAKVRVYETRNSYVEMSDARPS
jgi:6-pyruvoyltetrahydropterin/6-carboxytetrahydropterin synthase